MKNQTALLKEKILAHTDYLNLTIALCRNRIHDIELSARSNLAALSQDSSLKLLQARRMIAGLEKRLDHITGLLQQKGDNPIYDAFRLTQVPIPVPHDAVHALLTEPKLPDLAPHMCRKEIEALLATIRVEERKTAY